MKKIIAVFLILLFSIGHDGYAQTAVPPAPTEEQNDATPSDAKKDPSQWQRPGGPWKKPGQPGQPTRPQPPSAPAPGVPNNGPKALVFVGPEHIDVSVSTFNFKQPEKNKIIFQQNYPFELRDIFGDNNQAISLDQRKAFEDKIKEIIAETQGVGVKHPWILVSESFKTVPNMAEVIRSIRQNEKVLIFILPSSKETRLAYHALKLAKPELKDENFVLWYGDTNRLSLAMKGKNGYESYQGAFYGKESAAPKDDTDDQHAPSEEAVDTVDDETPAYQGRDHRKSWRERMAERFGEKDVRPISPAFKEAIAENQGKVFGAGDIFLALSKDNNHVINVELLQSLANQGDSPKAKIANALLKNMNELGVTTIEVVPIDISQSFRDIHR